MTARPPRRYLPDLHTPLTAREKRALTIWGPLILLNAGLDIIERDKGTLSEAHRTLRRRISPWGWRVVWGTFAVWFWRHVEQGDPAPCRSEAQ